MKYLNLLMLVLATTFITTTSFAQPELVAIVGLGDGFTTQGEIGYSIKNGDSQDHTYKIVINNGMCPSHQPHLEIYEMANLYNSMALQPWGNYVFFIGVQSGTTWSFHLMVNQVNSSYICKTLGSVHMEIWKL